MTVAAGVAHGTPQPPEPDLRPAEMIARAEAIAATLVERQAETEARTYYAPDVHEEFAKAGFYRILTPRRHGGYEFGVDTFVKVAMALARGCPSTGWMYVFGHAHTVAAATLFGEQAQAELFSGGDFICPATISPGGSAERTDDGWLISGTFPYCSGAPYATHFIGHTLVPQGPEQLPAPMLFAVPRGEFRRLDDWGDQLGLKGSGSHSIVLENVHVPEHRALPLHMSLAGITEQTPGHLLHDNPEYAGGPLGFMMLELGTLAVGMAKGALDAYEELMRTRLTSFFPIVARTEDPDFQTRYGEATGMIAAAEAALLGAVLQWSGMCARGPAAYTRDEELRIALISRESIRLSWRAVQAHLFPTAGSSSVRSGERIERVWRDMSTFHSHAGVAVYLNTLANRELARAHFGIA